tara:strand:- start:71 stop:469 length:399 start_codon:yes stop_codon:yes gene_type:complete
MLEIDHIVLTTKNIKAIIAFYTKIMRMKVKTAKNNVNNQISYSLHFGHQKINLHHYDSPILPNASKARPGTIDICFISNIALNTWKKKLASHNIEIIAGPIQRDGANTLLNSIYIRDPDNNLIEISNRIKGK